MYNAINSAFGLFTAADENTLRMMVVLSDGSTADTENTGKASTERHRRKFFRKCTG